MYVLYYDDIDSDGCGQFKMIACSRNRQTLEAVMANLRRPVQATLAAYKQYADSCHAAHTDSQTAVRKYLMKNLDAIRDPDRKCRPVRDSAGLLFQEKLDWHSCDETPYSEEAKRRVQEAMVHDLAYSHWFLFRDVRANADRLSEFLEVDRLPAPYPKLVAAPQPPEPDPEYVANAYQTDAFFIAEVEEL